MNWAWATSLDQLWLSPAFPMCLALAELGRGRVARSTLAFAVFSDVADIGRVGILRDHRSYHAVARREVRRQRRADGHHAAGHWHRRHRHHSRVWPGWP